MEQPKSSEQPFILPEVKEVLKLLDARPRLYAYSWLIIERFNIEIDEMEASQLKNLYQLNKLIQKKINMAAHALRMDIKSKIMKKRKEIEKKEKT